ncbi:hypothetical protein Trydic_g273 [Trypoxylus dichotomus]
MHQSRSRKEKPDAATPSSTPLSAPLCPTAAPYHLEAEQNFGLQKGPGPLPKGPNGPCGEDPDGLSPTSGRGLPQHPGCRRSLCRHL